MSFVSECKPRVVALLGNDSQHRNTLATLLRNEINVVGVCIANNKSIGIPLEYIIKSARKRGWFKIVSQIIARLIYLLRNWKRDKKLKSLITDNSFVSAIFKSRCVFSMTFAASATFILEAL